MCHSCASRNPDNMASYFLDCRFRGSDTLGLAPKGEASCFIRLNLYTSPRAISLPRPQAGFLLFPLLKARSEFHWERASTPNGGPQTSPNPIELRKS